ncbi:MAG: helix-turn-helix domain-containing protein [Bacteroidales bacterium]
MPPFAPAGKARGFLKRDSRSIGSSKSHIWRIESGRVNVGMDDLGRIADALDCTVASLINF